MQEFEKFKNSDFGEKLTVIVDRAFGCLDMITNIINLVPDSFFDYPDQKALVRLLSIEAFFKIQFVRTVIEKNKELNSKGN